MPQLTDLTQSIGYTFQQPKLLALALTHPSANAVSNSQRLEFLGDAVLQLCVSDWLYAEHPTLPEGQLTAMRAAMVCEDALYQVATHIGLDEHIRAVPPLKRNSRGRKSVMADAVEALLAAMYLDAGYGTAKAFVLRLWPSAGISHEIPVNSKSELQERLQAGAQAELEYRTLSQEGPPHQRRFVAAVYCNGQELARGEGSSKKAAEQSAALKALKTLKQGGKL